MSATRPETISDSVACGAVTLDNCQECGRDEWLRFGATHVADGFDCETGEAFVAWLVKGQWTR